MAMDDISVVVTSDSSLTSQEQGSPKALRAKKEKSFREINQLNLDLLVPDPSKEDGRVSPTPGSPSSSPRSSFKGKGGWAKIKRELITYSKEKSKENSAAESKTKNKEDETSPMNPPKSPATGRKNLDVVNNNNHYNSIDRKRTMRLLILGQDGVGKSAFIVRYLTRRFIGEYDPSLEGIFRKSINFNNQEINIEMKDTARGVNWPKRTNDLIWSDALIFIYSITNRNSFFEIQKISKQIEQQKKTRGIPCLIIGNKKDLSHERTVSFLEGSKLASIVHGTFCELSVSDNFVDLEGVVNHFIKENCISFKYPTTQVHMLASKSSPEIRQKGQAERPNSTPEFPKTIEVEESKTEKKGRALWQKLRTNNSDIKKSKK